MHDSEIQHKLFARLTFTIATSDDDPGCVALAWPSVIDGAIMWDRSAAIELSEPAFDAALDAALWAYRTLMRREDLNTPFMTRRIPAPLRGAPAPIPTLQFHGA